MKFNFPNLLMVSLWCFIGFVASEKLGVYWGVLGNVLGFFIGLLMSAIVTWLFFLILWKLFPKGRK